MQKLILDRRFWLFPVLGWTLLVSLSLYWNLNEANKHSNETVYERARFIFEMVSSMHLWNARHGGVYAAVDEQNLPTPYQEGRDLTTPSGRKLTLVNSVHMTGQLADIIHERHDLSLHLTSLNPLNPNNAANPWESAALERFEQDRTLTDWGSFSGVGEEREFRFIAPLVTEKVCLKCHEEQGYQEGDIRGGLSVTFPAGPLLASNMEQEYHFELIHLAIWMILTLLTLFGLGRHRQQLLQLQGVLAQQEKKVEERTAQLQQEVFAREAAEERMSLFIEASGEGLLVVDNLLRCTLSNPAARQILGYDREAQLLGRHIHDFLCPHKGRPPTTSISDCEGCRIRYSLEQATSLHDDMVSFMHSAGHIISVDMRCAPIEVEGHILGSVITFSDITDRKEQEEVSWRLANTDSLTGLINRHHFLGCLEQTFSEAERYERSFALLFIDLDGFKAVNDQFGHDVGDELLREGARRLLRSVRASDMVARLGGDEFTIIMPNIVELEEVEVLTRRLIGWLAEPFNIKGQQVTISASVGIAAYPYNGSDTDSLLNHADEAMYTAKSSGKNTFCWYQEEFCRQEA